MKRSVFIISFLLLVSKILSAENVSTIRDIQRELLHSQGTQRVDLLIRLSKAYRTISYHDCLKYGNEAILEANRLHSPTMAGLASKSLGVSSYLSGNLKDAFKNFEKGLKYYKQAGDKKGISNCLNDIGLVYESWSKFDESADYYQQSLTIEKQLGDPKGIATSLINLGNINYYRKAYQQALENYIQALQIYTVLKDFNGMGSAYNSEAIIYQELGEFNKSRDYLEKAREIYVKAGDKINLSKVLNNLADIYDMHFKKYKKALFLYEQTLTLKEETDNKIGVALVKCNLGALYGKLGNFSIAFPLLQESYNMYQELNDKSGQVMVLYNEGIIFQQSGKFKKALKYFQKGLKLARKIGYVDYVQKFNESSFICYAALGEYTNFSKYYGLYNASRNSLINHLEKQKTAEIEDHFKVKELTQKDKILKGVSQHQSEQIRKYQMISAIFAVAIIILLLAIIFYRKLKKNKEIDSN